MNYAHESYEEVIGEIVPLLMAHWQEIAEHKDLVPLDPDYDKYKVLEEQGILDIFTVRTDGGNLVGYCITLTGPHLHYKSTTFSNVDILYLDPDYRGRLVGLRFIKYVETCLRERGVQIFMHHVKQEHDYGPILDRLGYNKSETLHKKYIGK